MLKRFSITRPLTTSLRVVAHDGVALTGFHVEEVDAEIEFAVHADANALLDVLRFDHEIIVV